MGRHTTAQNGELFFHQVVKGFLLGEQATKYMQKASVQSLAGRIGCRLWMQTLKPTLSPITIWQHICCVLNASQETHGCHQKLVWEKICTRAHLHVSGSRTFHSYGQAGPESKRLANLRASSGLSAGRHFVATSEEVDPSNHPHKPTSRDCLLCAAWQALQHSIQAFAGLAAAAQS